MRRLGVVVIGRNEGERLVRCLRSVVPAADAVVYVDSGSTDGSVRAAEELGAKVVVLDRAAPFTAARARNEGLKHLTATAPDLDRVQFVDGDCEVDPDWPAAAHAALDADPKAAVVCGRRRERFPEASVYNRLCDLEWDTPAGEATACGGDAMMRVAPVRAAGGFRDSLIAGEEPELCARLRAAGGKVLRLPAEMTRHDAAMTRFGQWWRRAVRAGHAYAEVSALHGRGPDRTWRREARSNWFWGVGVPLLAVAAGFIHPLLAVALLCGYPVLGLRAYRARRRRGATPTDARTYAVFCVLAKFPMALGQARYALNRLLGRRPTLIEYKTAGPARPRVAYLVNQYPHVSHSFIRREIRGLEGHGIEVVRVSVRSSPAVVDADDRAEAGRTWVLLDRGLSGLLLAAATTAVTRPLKLLRALRTATRLGRRSGRRLHALVYLAEACRLVRRLRRERVTHLHAHFGTNPADVALLARQLGGPPFSFTVHGPEEFDRPDALSLGDKIAGAAFVVGVSSFGRSQLFRWANPADWPKVNVVRCGVDAAYLAAGPLPPAAGNRVVCVGRLAEQKGQLVLIEAAARLAADGLDFELVLAGNGPMRARIEAAVAEHRLENRVRITGWLGEDAVRAELTAARLMVLPSFAEGLPVVLMEALALGRPVVTTYVAGIPELVRPGETGWLVPAGDPAALAAALADGLRADPDRLAVMGRAGAAAVARMHDADREAVRLAELFRGTTMREAS